MSHNLCIILIPDNITLKLYFLHVSICCFYLDVSECCNTVHIDSNGLAKTLHSEKLGTYIAEGISNGRLLYKNHEGAYLYFAPSNKWMVSTVVYLLILIFKIDFKFY